MPFYEQGEYITESVRSFQAQSYAATELIVVDDGSVTVTAHEIVAPLIKPNIRTVRLETNSGLSVARNVGVTESRGDLILLWDSDDLFEPTFIAEAVSELSDPEIAVVYSDTQLFGDIEKTLYNDASLVRVMAMEPMPACLMYRREVFDSVGGYPEHMPYGADRTFCINALKQGWKFKHISKPLYRYRSHANGLSRTGRNRRFVNQVRENKELYVEHLEEVLLIREERYLETINHHHELSLAFNELLEHYGRVEKENEQLHARLGKTLDMRVLNKFRAAFGKLSKYFRPESLATN